MNTILEALSAGDEEGAARQLRERIAARQDAPDGHEEEARLAERLGLSTVAVRAWQLVLRDHPQQASAWEALARLHEERGDLARAKACRDALVDLGAEAPAAEAPPAPEPPPPGPSDADLIRFAHLFQGREGVHARMWHDPARGVGYSPVRQQLTPELVRSHLDGALTLGVYPVRRDDTVCWFVLDMDIRKPALERARGDALRTSALREAVHAEGLSLLRRARALGLAPLLEDSGFKGRHLWCFLPEPTPAQEVLRLAPTLLAALRPQHPDLHLELFPKQGRVSPDGLGNLVKLPMGLHLRSGRRSVLLDDEGQPSRDPFARLRAVEARPLPELGEAPPPPPAPTAPPSPPAPPPVEPSSWTEADFDTSPEVGAVLRGCATLRALVDGALKEKALDSVGVLALTHTLGHLAEGPRACNHLFDRLPDFPQEARMGAPLRGNPVSCGKLRRRLPELVATLPCDCSFAEGPGRYAHPLRHLEDLAEPAPRARTLDQLLDTYVRQQQRLSELEAELDGLRAQLVEALERVPGARWPYQGGEWRVESDGGLPVLRWATTP